MTAIGYIRQSRRADLDVALSYDSQLGAILRMAERDGITPDSVRILTDMGRSGAGGKERLRAGYQEVLEALNSGSVDVIYALSLTRLARSTPELYRVAQLAQERGVRLSFAKEGLLDPTTPLGKAQFGMMAVFAEFERDLAVERAKDNAAVRRARGQRMGRVPYGDRPGDVPDAVVAAWREAGSLNGAALLLNERKVPSHLGRAWNGTSVRLIVQRHAPGLLPRHTARGVKPSSPFLLYRLLRCSCGTTMTASRDGRGNRDVVYRCHAADSRPEHHRPYRIREAAVLPWIQAEAARFRPDWSVLRSAGADEERARLEDQRRAVGDAVVIRALTLAEAEVRIAAIEDRLATLDDRVVVRELPSIDWTKPPAVVNKVLRAFWRSVDLDEQMRPVRADWRVPINYLTPG